MNTVRINGGNDLLIRDCGNFSLAQTLDCGQAFRWERTEDGHLRGGAASRPLELYECDDGIVLVGVSDNDFNDFWYGYFDLGRDYGSIISAISDNEILKVAGNMSSGIRILKQDPWEAVCSFIISQNNNIPRIKGIVRRLCESFGESNDGFYGFPTAKRIAALNESDLATLRCGFRARYILDAARKYSAGEINEDILTNGDIELARAELQKITGVGPKVADCALLYGYGRVDAFPRDVWIKRAMERFFDGKLPPSAEPWAGIVQQYIFVYIRSLGE